MKKTFTILSIAFSLISIAQTQVSNPGFETWDGSGSSIEPTGWNSNKSGSSVAQLGPQICFQDATVKHSGSYSVRVETKSYFGTAVNGAVTTGVINAPNTTKSNGYIGTVNYSSSSDVRRMAFTGRPDSIVGYYQYTSGGAGEKGKVTAILHNNDYFDPETPTTYHADPTADKVARATFYTPTSNVGTWTRFSAPFVYTSSGDPAYIMVNITCSENQGTTITGSKMWIDDISFIYNVTTDVKEADLEKRVKVYYAEKNVFVKSSLSEVKMAKMEIYNITGQAVYSEELDLNNEVASINVSNFKSGVYMYKLTINSQAKFGKLLID